MKTVRWGIIGCGNVTEVKSGPGFQKASNSSLVAVMRRTGALARDYAARHDVPKWYDDAAALINDPEVDAVYVATPPSSHKEYTLLSAQAGKPVYVEKPMGLNFAECQEMIAACRDADVPLWVAYYRRSLARFDKIRTLLEEQAIGEVRAVSTKFFAKAEIGDGQAIPWRFLPETAGGGRFVDLASHTFDFLDYLFGPIQAVQGFAGNQGGYYPAEDIVTASFTFESGIYGTGLWWFTSPDEIDQTEILGTKGKISFSCFDEAPLVLTTRAGVTEFAIKYPPHVQQPLIQTIVDELNGSGSCPSSGESGARPNWVMDQILAGYYGFPPARA